MPVPQLLFLGLPLLAVSKPDVTMSQGCAVAISLSVAALETGEHIRLGKADAATILKRYKRVTCSQKDKFANVLFLNHEDEDTLDGGSFFRIDLNELKVVERY